MRTEAWDLSSVLTMSFLAAFPRPKEADDVVAALPDQWNRSLPGCHVEGRFQYAGSSGPTRSHVVFEYRSSERQRALAVTV